MAITFDNIAGGELAEKFTMALAQIGRNILDPNMDPIAARGMTINLKFKPGSRGTIDIEFDIKTKLAGFQKSQTVFLVGQDINTGRIEMSEYGSDRPQVTSVAAAPAAAYTEVRQPAAQTFDPATGEIYEEPRKGPIDLRAAANQ
ncbi:MAG: hypothetical protein HP010_20185 [Clostridium sp.]|uniref:hypothetical protein n=1 Tax=Enterocloster aldenensis TaxID=358742 RepID=UPI000E4D89BA|nr:hypothetical protein [Clostridium sp.]RHB40882.1 hypothetical protein DW886_17785 [Enterocloster aldenensis]